LIDDVPDDTIQNIAILCSCRGASFGGILRESIMMRRKRRRRR